MPIDNSNYMPCLPSATLSNDGNVPGISTWVRKMPNCMISTKIIFVQNNVKILSGQNVLIFFYDAPSFSDKPKLDLKV